LAKLARFGVSLEETLLRQFDSLISKNKYGSRSEALRDLIRGELVKKQWQENDDIAGAITLVYDHHQRELVHKL
jgi:CopG family nickel-responsive transcriptional regulator